MRTALLVSLSICLQAISEQIPSAAAAEPARIRVLIIGDSTVASYANPPADRPDLTGWGQVFGRSFDERVEVLNHARSGRSSKSFQKEGLWRKALAEEPDFVFIQFGHNDCPGKGDRSTDPKTDFRDYLTKYIDDARDIGARPILVTPMTRRVFVDGAIRTKLRPYADAMIAVGKQRRVPVIDLHAASVQMFNRLGDRASSDLSASPSDRTHFSRKGATAMARLIVARLKVAEPAFRPYLSVAPVASDSGANWDLAKAGFREWKRFKVAEAHQAVAVDESSFFAISNRSIGRYAKDDAKQLAKWSAEADSPILHLNSGVVINRRLYCANSNWPNTPLKNSVEVFDAGTLRHLERRTFPETEGAINWIDRRGGFWWIVFACYGKSDVHRTRLVRYDDRWQADGEWRFPESVTDRFLPNSNSGGSFGPNGYLYLTGHDRAELYVVAAPVEGKPLRHLANIAAPIAGQGIAWDRGDVGTLYGIVRKTREVVTMRRSGKHIQKKKPVESMHDQ